MCVAVISFVRLGSIAIMSHKDSQKLVFDEGTLAKLSIFEDYAQAWIPTFVMQNFPKICIFDFFAGNGYDDECVPGSAIRLLHKIKEQIHHILDRRVRVGLWLNELKKKRYIQLKAACEEFLRENPEVASAIDIEYFNKDFDEIFKELLPEIRRFPSLVYLDQYGIKYLSPGYIAELERTRQTDFLYFTSSSFFARFGNSDEFKVHFEIDMDEVKNNPYKFIHRILIKQIQNSLPANSNLRLYPFSIKKGSNIYGIVFGAKHCRAAEKFIEIAWKRDPSSGEANFDINDEIKKDQRVLFGDQPMKKKEAFEHSLQVAIKNGTIVDNQDALEFALKHGHPPKHAADVLRLMKKNKQVWYTGQSPLVRCEHRNRILKYEVLSS